MDRNHDALVQHHIEEAYNRGWTVIPWWALYVWYDMERLTKTAWRDILDRWRAVTNGDASEPILRVYRGAEGVLLVKADGKKVPAEKEVLVRLEVLADDMLAKL